MEMPDAMRAVFGGRARHSWSDRAIAPALIDQLYDLVKLGPTSMNTCPARFLFLVSQESRSRLASYAMEANKGKIESAPCVVIIAMDEKFYDKMETLFPSRSGVAALFSGNASLASETAFRNSSMQGAYLLVAARLLGLDCCPMSGFDNKLVDNDFLAGTSWRSNFLCALGYANDDPHPRLPRLSFDEAAAIQ